MTLKITQTGSGKIGYITFLLTWLCFSSSLSQVPVPAPPQDYPITLVGGTAHIANGDVIENCVIQFKDGKITFVGKAGESVPDDNSRFINIAGKHVYPGIIAPNTTLGLNEIDAVRATRDYRETGTVNPNVRSIISYNTDSRIIPTVRSNGILVAQVIPVGGLISGTSSVVELDAWNWEEAAYKSDLAVHVNWPSIFNTRGWWAEPGGREENKDYKKTVNELYDYFEQAKAYYAENIHLEKNLRFEAMCGLFNGEKKLIVHTNGSKEIMAAVDFKKYFNLDVIIAGGKDAWMVAGILRQNKIPVILGSLHALPSRAEDDIDLPYKTPYMLHQAGVEFCFSMQGSWEQRNLIFMAGTAAAYGLNKEEALMSITANTARILGLENLGTLEAGKDATLIISTGDILDMRTSNIETAFIRGREIDLDNKQKALYRKFRDKYY